MRSVAEVESLRELLADFGVVGWGPERAEETYHLIRARQAFLADSYVETAEVVERVLSERLSPPRALAILLRMAHESLFGDILTNAGKPRRFGDAGGSRVYFGGNRGDRREPRFTGTPAAQIDTELAAAFERLEDCRGNRTDEAPDRAILFYADLSRIHPFYDGNGRAGRFVVSVYLHLHGWLVEWGRIEAREGEFMRRINNVIEKKTAVRDYDADLLRYWRRHVIRTDDFE